MDIKEWVCVGLRGSVWVCVGLRGSAWVCVGLRPLGCWNCGLEFRRERGCECCVLQIEVSATGRSPVQRNLTECGVSRV
jgi:hypothetical protein